MITKKPIVLIVAIMLFQIHIFGKAISDNHRIFTLEKTTSNHKKKAFIIISSENDRSFTSFSSLFSSGVERNYQKNHSIYTFKKAQPSPLSLSNLHLAEKIATTILTLKKDGVTDITMVSIGSGIIPATLTSQLLTIFDTEMSFSQKKSLNEVRNAKKVKQLDTEFKRKKSNLWKVMEKLFPKENNLNTAMGKRPRNNKFIHSDSHAHSFIKTLYIINPTDKNIRFFFDFRTIEKLVWLHTSNKKLSKLIGSAVFNYQSSKKIHFCSIRIDTSSLSCNSCLPCKKKMGDDEKVLFSILFGMRIKKIGPLCKAKHTKYTFSLDISKYELEQSITKRLKNNRPQNKK